MSIFKYLILFIQCRCISFFLESTPKKSFLSFAYVYIPFQPTAPSHSFIFFGTTAKNLVMNGFDVCQFTLLSPQVECEKYGKKFHFTLSLFLISCRINNICSFRFISLARFWGFFASVFALNSTHRTVEVKCECEHSSEFKFDAFPLILRSLYAHLVGDKQQR